MRDGECSEQSTLARRTDATESGLRQTPVANDSVNRVDGLATAVRMWPTPMARDWKDTAKSGNRKSPNLGAEVHWPTPRTKGMCGGSGAWQKLKEATTIEEARMMGAGNGGQLNPTWVEWLMGWPLEWTDLRPLATDKFQQWRRLHGAFSAENEL